MVRIHQILTAAPDPHAPARIKSSRPLIQLFLTGCALNPTSSLLSRNALADMIIAMAKTGSPERRESARSQAARKEAASGDWNLVLDRFKEVMWLEQPDAASTWSRLADSLAETRAGLDDPIVRRDFDRVIMMTLEKLRQSKSHLSVLAPLTSPASPLPTKEPLNGPIATIIERAAEVIGDRQAAMRWLGTPVRALDYATPISILATAEGAERVTDVLGQMERGVW
jgi:hypothetical protein